jgi:hypothetical protein
MVKINLVNILKITGFVKNNFKKLDNSYLISVKRNPSEYCRPATDGIKVG